MGHSPVRPFLAVVLATIVLGLAAAGPCPAAFTDVTAPAGLSLSGSTWGATFADLDGDGDLDLYSGRHGYEPVLSWNDGAGVFDASLHPQPWTGPVDRHGVLLVSLDMDEDPEVVVLHGGGAGPEANELFRNDGGGELVLLPGSGGLSDAPARSRAVSAADFDGDRRVDLWVGKAPFAGHENSLFRNDGLLSFTDVAPSVGLDEGDGTVGGIWGDFDDDGDPDLFVGGEEFSRPSKLYRNDGGTAFADVSSSFSPALPVVSGADWGDLDNDGDLDLAVCDGSIGLFDTYAEGDSITYYFNTRFGDAGMDGLTIPSSADTLYARFRLRGTIYLWLVFLGPDAVNPPPDFPFVLTDEYVGAPSFTPGVDQGTWIWRTTPGGDWEIRCSSPNLGYDTFDGWVMEGSPITGVVPTDLEDPGFTPGGPRVWRNDGGSFTEITASWGLSLMLNPRDVSWVDYDNDGDLDLHVVDMGTSAAPNADDRLLRNEGDHFTDVTAAETVAGGPGGMGDGGVWGDVDGDGDLDLYLAQGAGPNTFYASGNAILYRNEQTAGNSIQLDLVGTDSGPIATGTRVCAFVEGAPIPRRVAANSWRSFADPLRVHLGIGSAQAADSVVIEWTSGRTERYQDVLAGTWRVEEGATLTSVRRRPAHLAPGSVFLRVWPQPGRDEQWVRVGAEGRRPVSVSIHDVRGRLLRRLYHGVVPPEGTLLRWDGRDERGALTAAGVYFVRATDGRAHHTARAIRIH